MWLSWILFWLYELVFFRTFRSFRTLSMRWCCNLQDTRCLNTYTLTLSQTSFKFHVWPFLIAFNSWGHGTNSFLNTTTCLSTSSSPIEKEGWPAISAISCLKDELIEKLCEVNVNKHTLHFAELCSWVAFLVLLVSHPEQKHSAFSPSKGLKYLKN